MPLLDGGLPARLCGADTQVEGSSMALKWKDRTPIRSALIAALLLFAAIPSVSATTYYVDPAPSNCAARNANAGTDPANPWCNPPGTRTANSSGYFTTSWGNTQTPGGPITSSHKIACGDVILLRGGSTQTSAQGGSWWLTPVYYAGGCSAGARMTIRVATGAEWSGSSGNFTLNGAGVTASTDPVYFGDTGRSNSLVTIIQSWIQLLGSPTQHIVLRNSSNNGLFIGYWAVATVGARVDWVDINTADNYGIMACYADNWQVSNVTVQLVGNGGLTTGCAADSPIHNGAYVNTTVFNSGCGSVAAPSCTSRNSGAEDAYNFSGGYSMWCVNCTAHDTGERGFSGGFVNDNNPTTDQHYHWRNIVAYRNGVNNDGSVSGSGFRPSGSDWVGTGRIPYNHVVGYLGWGNRTSCEGPYGGNWAELWHTTCHHNGFGYGGSGEEHNILTDSRYQAVLNSIAQGSGPIIFASGTSNGALPQRTFTYGAFNNCFRPQSADTESVSNGWPGAGTFANPPSFLVGNGNKIGRNNCNGGAAGTSPYANASSTTFNSVADYALVAGSTAIDAGRFFLLANGAGNGTTITAKANGGWADPRDFFISPTSYLDAVPDIIQIQNATCAAGSPVLASGRAVITSMTATTITLDRACSWVNNAGVHLPWTGSAPDMGAFEFGSGGPPAPTLLSVEPVTP